ncbi:MAG: branched-chain amino acid ABC transporter permease, partial [Oscillospiraceae bacterium]|nr:branched-chain amino acid ABC transporter permease [Oscillospiraceae bacterium]
MKNILTKKQNRSKAATFAVVIIAYILLQLAMGTLKSSVKGMLVPICVYIVMAISLNLTVGVMGELSLGHASFMSVGAFTGASAAYLLSGSIQSNAIVLTLSMVVGAIFAGIFGFLIG